MKKQTRQVKWMVFLILMLLVGVCLRWAHIRSEAGEAIRQRMNYFKNLSINAPICSASERASAAGSEA